MDNQQDGHMGGQHDMTGLMAQAGGTLTIMHGPDDDVPSAQAVIQDPRAAPQHTTCCVGDLVVGPNPWSRQLVLNHLDAPARLALFRTCTTGRDMLLGTAAHLHIRMFVQQTAKGLVRLQAVNTALAVWGRLSTQLELKAAGATEVGRAVEVLAGSLTWVDELHLNVDAADPLPSHLLASIGRACPNLRALRIFSARQLPSPEVFPKLKQLGVDTLLGEDDMEYFCRSFCHSVAPYIKQLTSLTLPWLGIPPAATLQLGIILSPHSVGAQLHTLHLLDTALDDTLLDLILQCAPAVEELSVNVVRLRAQAHAHTPHRWRQLQFSYLCLSSLHRLPLVPGLQLTSSAPTMSLLCDATFQTASLTERGVAAWLRGAQLGFTGRSKQQGQGAAVSITGSSNQAATVIIRPAFPFPAQQQPSTLRLGLSLLHHWSPTAHQPSIRLERWTMSAELLPELQRLPRWGRLDMDKSLVWLPQRQAYSTMLGLLPASYHTVSIHVEGLSGPQVRRVCVGAQNRTPETPLRIELVGPCAPRDLGAIALNMLRGLAPNVTVRMH